MNHTVSFEKLSQKQRMKMFHSATENYKMALKYVILISLGDYVLIHNLLFIFTNGTSFSQIFHFKRRFGQIMYLFHEKESKKRNIF